MIFECLDPRLCLAAGLGSAGADGEPLLVAFPGAEGFGRFAQGGRGGDVYHVQNLKNSGPGSLREGIDTAIGARTIVFDVGGTIFLESGLRIDTPYITLAGETAPGDGISLAGDMLAIVNTHDVIVRYIRSRPGDILGGTQHPASRDSFQIHESTNVILDHVSGTWSIDEVFSFAGPGDLTIQWSIAAEALNESVHPKGNHSAGSLTLDGNVSLHHNLFVSNNRRNPLVQQATDVVNNVVYNFGVFGAIIGFFGGGDPNGPTHVNLEGNYYIAGPDTLTGTQRMVRLFELAEVWTKDNFVDFDRNGILDGTLATNANIEFHDTNAGPEGIVVENRFDYPQVTTSDAVTAYGHVLAHAGASLVRDPVDLRLIDEVMEQTGQIIDSQDEVGGWPALAGAEPPLDTDQDGMPDYWENRQNLDPQDAEDRNLDNDGDGYTELEEYLHYLASGRVIDRVIAEVAENGSIVGGDSTQTHDSDNDDDGTVESSSLPADLRGTVYVRAVDTSNRDDHAATLYVDNIYIIDSQVERQLTSYPGAHAAEMVTVLPMKASKPSPTEPAEMVTVLPLLASQSSPAKPPKIWTRGFSLEPSRSPALSEIPITPPAKTFSCVSDPSLGSIDLVIAELQKLAKLPRPITSLISYGLRRPHAISPDWCKADLGGRS